jgi:hypothetical protein
VLDFDRTPELPRVAEGVVELPVGDMAELDDIDGMLELWLVVAVTLVAVADGVGSGDIWLSDRDKVGVTELDDTSDAVGWEAEAEVTTELGAKLLIVIVEVTLLGDGLTTVEGTGMMEVSLGTGDAREPDIPVKLKKFRQYIKGED